MIKCYRIWCCVLILVVILADQTTKWLAQQMLLYLEPVSMFSWFNFTLVYNRGAAFSFLADQGGWQRWFFTLTTIFICVYLWGWMWRLNGVEKRMYIALGCIIGGGLGNLIDRLVYGYVIDFIDWHIQQYHWPAFNIADAMIFIGVGLLLLDQWLNRNQQADAKATKAE